MARIGIHHDAHTAPGGASKGLRRLARRYPWLGAAARAVARWEATAARHWPLTAYTALTLATAAYVITQMNRV